MASRPLSRYTGRWLQPCRRPEPAETPDRGGMQHLACLSHRLPVGMLRSVDRNTAVETTAHRSQSRSRRTLGASDCGVKSSHACRRSPTDRSTKVLPHRSRECCHPRSATPCWPRHRRRRTEPMAGLPALVWAVVNDHRVAPDDASVKLPRHGLGQRGADHDTANAAASAPSIPGPAPTLAVAGEASTDHTCRDGRRTAASPLHRRRAPGPSGRQGEIPVVHGQGCGTGE